MSAAVGWETGSREQGPGARWFELWGTTGVRVPVMQGSAQAAGDIGWSCLACTLQGCAESHVLNAKAKGLRPRNVLAVSLEMGNSYRLASQEDLYPKCEDSGVDKDASRQAW